MIREADLSDIPRIVDMGEAMHGALDLDVPFEPDDFAETVTQQIMDSSRLMLVTDDLTGMFAGISAPFFFNYRERYVAELFWWMEESARGRGLELLRGFEEWARSMGASKLVLSFDARTKQHRRFLEERMGFELQERVYAKWLSSPH